MNNLTQVLFVKGFEELNKLFMNFVLLLITQSTKDRRADKNITRKQTHTVFQTSSISSTTIINQHIVE